MELDFHKIAEARGYLQKSVSGWVSSGAL